MAVVVAKKPARPSALGADPADLGLIVKAVEVTPEIAAYWLDLRRTNRGMKEKLIAKLVATMMAGQFAFNGEPILFATDEHDSLIDGQNRLEAVVRSGTTQTMLVVWNVGEVMTTVDIGVSRTTTDVFRLRGEDTPQALDHAVSCLWRHLNGKDATTETPPTPVAEKLVDSRRYVDLRYSVDKVRPFVGPRRAEFSLPHGMVGFTHFAFTRIDPERGQEFFDKLLSGTNLTEHDPILVLRRALIAMRAAGAKTWRQHQKKHNLAYLVQAWNAYYEGRQVDRVWWDPTKDFPPISGDVLLAKRR